MAEEITTAEILRLGKTAITELKLADISWEHYAAIEEWFRDPSRSGCYASNLEREVGGKQGGKLFRVYRVSNPDTAMEFKMRWM